MRVSEPTKVAAVINNMNTTAAKQQKLAEQISSGKRVLRPSDDPAASDKIELYKRDIQRGDTITKDSNYNQLWLNLVDSSTSQMVDLLREAKVKALEAANSYQTEESQQAIAAEVEALQQELEGLANSKLDKIYIYSGSRTLTSPLLKNSPENLPSYNMVPKWWLSKASVGKEELNALVEASRNDDLVITLNVSELDPADTSGALPAESKLIGGQQEIKLRVLPSDTRETLVNKLNAAFAARYADVQDPNFPGEKIQDAYFYLAPDGKIGVQSYPNVDLTFGSALQEVVNFEVPPKSAGVSEQGMFGEFVSGYHEKPYNVRITKGGEIGQATYTVSDDGGKTWSREKVLDWKNEIFNPTGNASNQVTLNFSRPGMRLFFCPGLEFELKENPVVRYQGNDDKRMVPTETADKTAINTTARQLFFKTSENTVNVFDVLERLKNNVIRSDIPEISKQMDELDASINQVLKFRAKAGVTSRRLQNTTDRIASKNFEETSSLSDAQDLDIAKASTDMNQNQIQQQAAMETTARVLSQSLVQFLR